MHTISVYSVLRCTMMIFFPAAAAYADLRTGRIPNALTFSFFGLSLLLRILENGPAGLLLFCAGASPAFLLLIAYRFRMIGAGDIKLLLCVGSLWSFRESLLILFAILLCGGVFSLLRMYRYHMFSERFGYFFRYLQTVCRSGTILPYRKSGRRPENLPFAVPVFVGSLVFLWVKLCADL